MGVPLGTTVYIADNGIHADIIMPVEAQALDWRPLIPPSDFPGVPPHPGWIAFGSGERYTLRLVAKYADMANIWGGTPEYVRQKFEVLRSHCDEIGRDYDAITRSNHLSVLLAESEPDLAAKRERYSDFPAGPPVIGTPEQVIARLQEYIDVGTQYIIVDLADWQEDTESIRRFAQMVMKPLGAGQALDNRAGAPL